LITIRRTTAVDADRVKLIRLEALSDTPDAYGSTYPDAVVAPPSRWVEFAASVTPCYLALDEERPVGMASGGLFPPFPQARWLYGMYVTPQYRGTGVAERLVRTVAEWARSEGVDTLGLHVTITVERAKAFYEKLGFAAIGDPQPMERDASLRLQTMTIDLRDNDRL
jgi:GNAT superfamily N-acetyltransferase